MNGKICESGVQENKPVKNLYPEVPGWGYRHQQCLVLLICLTIAYSVRSCMGVVLVAMTDVKLQTQGQNATNVHITSNVYENESIVFWNSMMLSPPYPTFNWSTKVQDVILSSFFWGYMVMQIPGGVITLKFGVKKTLTVAMVINSITCILLPWAAVYGDWFLVVLCRITQGLSQAFLFPGMHTFFGKWAPLHERSRLAAYVYGGQAIGVVTGTPLAGVIASSGMGWPGVFRVFGVITGIIGGLVWWILADTPAQHTSISESERLFIEQEMGRDETGKNRPPTPWSAILKSTGMWAIISAHVGLSITHIFMFTEMPSYIDKILKVDLKLNGLLVALPFLTMWISNFFFSWMTDLLIYKKVLSVTNTRKFASCVGCIPSAILFIILCYVPTDIYIFEFILVLMGAIKIAALSGSQVNHIDISPNFAGPMMSISNFVANAFASLTPTMTSFILGTESTNEGRWKQVFLVLAAVLFISNLFYIIFGTSEIASWNDANDKVINVDNNEETEPMVQISDEIEASKEKEENRNGYGTSNNL